MSLFIPFLSLSLFFPDVIQLSISSIFPSLQDIIPFLILSSSTLSLFYLTTFLNAALVLILFPFVPANSLGDGNKSGLAWLRQTSGDVDGWWGIYRITGGVGWLIGFALRTRRITVGRCEMMGWCIAQPSLMKRRKWTWTMLLQASISLPFTSVAACLCVPGALPEFKKRTQLFLDKNKLAIAVQSCFCRTCRHKHTAAKYSCHSNLFCMQNLVIYDSDNSILRSNLLQ